MFGTLGKFWRSLIRYPLLVLLGGVVVGVPIGWFLASRSTIEQIPLAPVKATAYAKLSSEELKIKSDQMVTAIRGLARAYYDEDRRMQTAADENSGKTDSSAERERLRNAWLAESAQLHDVFMDRYTSNYWADALLLREA
ncbi:MAG: hypothetical protein ACXW6J_22095, partial [Candidatus Binatia bacterium]